MKDIQVIANSTSTIRNKAKLNDEVRMMRLIVLVSNLIFTGLFGFIAYKSLTGAFVLDFLGLSAFAVCYSGLLILSGYRDRIIKYCTELTLHNDSVEVGVTVYTADVLRNQKATNKTLHSLTYLIRNNNKWVNAKEIGEYTVRILLSKYVIIHLKEVDKVAIIALSDLREQLAVDCKKQAV